jgi:hypothetical protein
MHKEMFSILSHKGNVNQNYTEISSYPSQNGNQETKQQMLARMQGKRKLIHCWWEYKLLLPLWKSVQMFLKKCKVELQYDPAIPLLGIYLEYKSTYKRDTSAFMFIVALFAIVKL